MSANGIYPNELALVEEADGLLAFTQQPGGVVDLAQLPMVEFVRRFIDAVPVVITADAQAAAAAAVEARSGAEAARDIAADFAGDIVSQGNVPIFSSRVSAAAVAIPAGLTVIRTNGFAVRGDLGAGTYKRVASNPGTRSSFRSTDRIMPDGSTDPVLGGYWELADMSLRTVQQHGVVGADETEDTAGFAEAISIPGRVLMTKIDAAYELTGTINMASGVILEMVDTPDLKVSQDGIAYGIVMPPGTVHSHVRGDCNIEFHVSNITTTGGTMNVFMLGQFDLSGGDPLPVRYCSITGNISVHCNGPNNGKAIAIYGYVEDVAIQAPTVTGVTNFAIAAHWAGNGIGGDGLPTKTWHPHRLRVLLGRMENQLALADAYRFSGCGTIWVEKICSKNPDESWTFSVGDYGYTYAQNISQEEGMQLFAEEIFIDNCGRSGLSVDGQTAGKNGAPYWTGSDYAAKVVVDKMTVRPNPTATACVSVAISHVLEVTIRDLTVLEESDTNASNFLTLFGVWRAQISGRAVTRNGILARCCNDVQINMSVRMRNSDLITSNRAVAISATSLDVQTAAAGNVGDTQLQIASSTLVTGPGGSFLYNDGTRTYEVALRSTTHTGSAQSFKCDPLPVAIPADATITLIQRVNSLRLAGSRLDGFASGLRVTGTATARCRNVDASHASFVNCATYDIDADTVDGYTEIGSLHSGGGRGLTNGNAYGTRIGPNARDAIVMGCLFDRTCGGTGNVALPGGLRYLVYTDAGSQNVMVANNRFMAVNANAASPAAIFRGNTTSLTIANNMLGAGVNLQYPA